MRQAWVRVGTLLLAGSLFGQADRGTITGIIFDPSGAVVTQAKITATNRDTGDAVATVSTDTGNYTLPSLPIGVWNLSVEAPGFKKFLSERAQIEASRSIRIDVHLELGNLADTVVVQAEAVALKTESADQSTTVREELIRELPINWTGSFYGTQAVRNPLSILQIMPGVGGGTSVFGSAGQAAGGSSLNGAPPGSFKILLEGQDSTPLFNPGVYYANQSSVEALQEFTLQSSNYAAEFGQSQGGIFSFTTKSGTNQFHGGLFYRLTNEALNAHQPYTGARAPSRQNNYGGTFGGPVILPRLYNGHNRTFFFFSFEGFNSISPFPNSGTYTTVPNAADRVGNFQADLGAQLACPNASTPCKDALGNAAFAGQIYDPKTLGSDGITRLAFPSNIIPTNRLDPVALKVQSYLPAPTNNLRALNYLFDSTIKRPQYLPSLKIDHNFSDRFKLSGYSQGQWADSVASPDGLPDNIAGTRKMPIYSHTERVNVDYTLRPNMLLHLGSGIVWYDIPQASTSVGNFDSRATLGLTGAVRVGFPRFTGLSNTSPAGAPLGGMAIGVGANFDTEQINTVFTNAASLTWISGSHSYKFGGTLGNRRSAYTSCSGGWGTYGFSAAQTGEPGIQNQTVAGAPGLGYASFLLGLPSSASVNPCGSVNWLQQEWGLFAQDNWKIRRNLTLELGIRYDLLVPPYENRNRISSFSAKLTNPSAGNLPGAVIYQGFGPGTCNCKNFYQTYKFAFGPRFGLAYQINPKTVLRAGWGMFYGTPVTGTATPGNTQDIGTGVDSANFGSSNGSSALPNGLQGGLIYGADAFTAFLHSPGAAPNLNASTGLSNLNAPNLYDAGFGRPPRTMQYNIALQRQITKEFNLEAAYVGNRGVWLYGSMNPLNAVTPELLASRGLSLSNPASLSLLTQQMRVAAVQTAGFKVPFATFPSTNTLATAMRPFPQYASSLNAQSASGNSWYDSLQIKANVRFRQSLSGLATYTWAKSFTRTGLFNDWRNIDNLKQLDSNLLPQALQLSMMYQSPHLAKASFLGGNLVTRHVLSDWQISGVLRYQSGALIQAPSSNNNLSTYMVGAPTQYMTRAPGQPLYLTDINGDIDPTKQLLLNPAAWAECSGTATFGCGAPLWGDFRQRRTPTEQISLGRRVQLGERGGRYFEIRFDMLNPFNRLVFPNTGVGNPLAKPSLNSNGLLTGGFGFMNVNNINPGSPRNMLIVARLAF